jgi:hypothetical protein
LRPGGDYGSPALIRELKPLLMAATEPFQPLLFLFEEEFRLTKTRN